MLVGLKNIIMSCRVKTKGYRLHVRSQLAGRERTEVELEEAFTHMEWSSLDSLITYKSRSVLRFYVLMSAATYI